MPTQAMASRSIARANKAWICPVSCRQDELMRGFRQREGNAENHVCTSHSCAVTWLDCPDCQLFAQARCPNCLPAILALVCKRLGSQRLLDLTLKGLLDLRQIDHFIHGGMAGLISTRKGAVIDPNSGGQQAQVVLGGSDALARAVAAVQAPGLTSIRCVSRSASAPGLPRSTSRR